MSNANVNLIQTSNTFDTWRTRDNNLANTLNELRNGNFYKDGGNFIVATGSLIVIPTFGTGLQIGGDALIGGTTTMNTQITTGQASIFGNVLMRSALNVAGPFFFNANNSTYKLDINGDATVNNLIVQGNTSTLGTSTMVTDTLVLRTGLATIGSGWLNVHRGAANTEASQRWNETTGLWESMNVASNTFYPQLTTFNIADVITSTSTNNVATANAVKTAYDHGTSAYNQANTANTQANNAYAQANLAYAAANSAAGGGLLTTGGTMTGNIKMTVGTQVQTPTLVSVREGITTINALSSPYTANLANTNIFDITDSVANLTITFANAPASGNSYAVTLLIHQPSITANGFTMSNTVKWSNGEIPVLASGTAGKVDILTFITVDGGTTFYGAHAMANC